MALGTYALTTLARFKAWIGDSSSTNDTTYEYAIDAATARIENYIGRQIMARDRIEFYDPMGHDSIVLKQWPVNSCRFVGNGAKTSLLVTENTVAADLSATVGVQETLIRTVRNQSTLQMNTTLDYDFGSSNPAYTTAAAVQPILNAASGYLCSLECDAPLKFLHKVGPIDVTYEAAYLTFPDIRSTDFRIEGRNGLLRIGQAYIDSQWSDAALGPLGSLWKLVCVDYNAGYSSVPADIEQACWMIAKALWSMARKDPTVNSESLGDYSYTSGGTGVIQELLEETLAGWREIR